MDASTAFGPDDHRNFNRDGQSFDKGETFSGVDFETGLRAVEEIKRLFPDPENLPAYALRWILMYDAVSCVIPGASRLGHVGSNAQAADLPPLTPEQMAGIGDIYEKYLKADVHQCW
jgi:aryl-alcohol dehydrogenase-like predicted oxidoreductase